MDIIVIRLKKLLRANKWVLFLYVKIKLTILRLADVIYLNTKKKSVSSDETKESYLIVRAIGNGKGLFCYIANFLPFFEQAERMGRIPVVDMKRYKTPYLDVPGKENAWLSFFTECVHGHSLELAERSGRAKYFWGSCPQINLDKIMHNDLDEIARWNRLYSRYVHLNKRVQGVLDQEYELLFKEKYDKCQKILGVKLRGTDYNSVKPSGHYIQPTALEMIEYAEKVLYIWGGGFVYLATEDRAIADMFQERFGEKLIMRNNWRVDGSDIDEMDKTDTVALMVASRCGAIVSGIDYIVDTYLLAKTSALLTSGNGGALMAIIINGGNYENVYFLDKGKYR